MGSGPSRSVSASAEEGDHLYPGELGKPTISLIHAVRQLASSSSSPPVSPPLKTDEASTAGFGEKGARSSRLDASSSCAYNGKDTPDSGAWDSILLSLAESSSLPSSLSSDFLWRELLVPLLVGNPTNGQLRALFVFFARTLHRYAEAVEATHDYLASFSRTTTSSTSKTPSQSDSDYPPHPTVVAVAVRAKQQEESSSPSRRPQFPCSDASLSELALLIRVLTKTLCSRLSFPQLLYHLEYTPSDFSRETNAHIASLLYVLSSPPSPSGGRRGYFPPSPEGSSHELRRPDALVRSADHEASREYKQTSNLSVAPDSTPPPSARHQVNDVPPSTASCSGEEEDTEVERHSKNEAFGTGCPDSGRSSGSQTPVTNKAGLSCEGNTNTTPTTTATLEGSLPSNESQKMSLALDPSSMQNSLRTSPTTTAADRKELLQGNNRVMSSLSVFLLSYRGAFKVLPASRSPSPVVLHREILSWLYEVYPEDACAASSRGFVFRGLARFDTDSSVPENTETMGCTYSGEELGSERNNPHQVTKRKKRKEIFLSLNDLASPATMAAVFEPLRLDRKALLKEAVRSERMEETTSQEGIEIPLSATSGEDRGSSWGQAGQEEDIASRRLSDDHHREGGVCDSADGAGIAEQRKKGERRASGEFRSKQNEDLSAKAKEEKEHTRRPQNAVNDHAGVVSADDERMKDEEEQQTAAPSPATTIFLAELTVVPLWIPLSPSPSSPSCSSSVIGSVADALARFVTVTQPPSPCCSPLVLRTHQHLLELLLALSAVISPIQLTAACLPRPLALRGSRHRKRVQAFGTVSDRKPELRIGIERPHVREMGGHPDQSGTGRIGGSGEATAREKEECSFKEGKEASVSSSVREGRTSLGRRGGRDRQTREALLIPPLCSPCSKLAPSFYAWQQEAQQLRVARCIENTRRTVHHPQSERGAPTGTAEDRKRPGGEPQAPPQLFPPVAAGALLPDLSLLEIFLSRCEGSERAELRAKEFAAYLLNLVWPSSALLLPPAPSSDPSFVSIPPALAHCALSVFLLLTFYPHPSTRAALSGCCRRPRQPVLRKRNHKPSPGWYPLLQEKGGKREGRVPPYACSDNKDSQKRPGDGPDVLLQGSEASLPSSYLPPTSPSSGGKRQETGGGRVPAACPGNAMSVEGEEGGLGNGRLSGVRSCQSSTPQSARSGYIDRRGTKTGRPNTSSGKNAALNSRHPGDRSEAEDPSETARSADSAGDRNQEEGYHHGGGDSERRGEDASSLLCSGGTSSRLAAQEGCRHPCHSPRRGVPSNGPSFFCSAQPSQPVVQRMKMARRLQPVSKVSVEANVFSLAFSSLYDSSHFSLKKCPLGGQQLGDDEEEERRFLTFPPSSSLNFEGLLVQLCSPQALAHPLKPLLLYLLLCRNRCFRLFYLSRSDGERLVLPVLQILNTLPRVLQHPPALSPAATKTGREDRPFVSPRSPLSVAPPFAAICGVCLLTLSKDKSFCSELFKKVVKEVPWLEQGKAQVVSNISLGSILVLVLLRLLSWNLRRCGDLFFLLLCSSIFLNISTSVEQLHWYVADRLVDYTAALLRQLERHLPWRDFFRARLMSARLPLHVPSSPSVLGGMTDTTRGRQTAHENQARGLGNEEREAEGQLFYPHSLNEGKGSLNDAQRGQAYLQGRFQETKSPEVGQQYGGKGEQGEEREQEADLGHDHLEGILIASRALLTFTVTALRPPSHQKNLPLLFAVLRLFPVDTGVSLVSRFQAAWLYTHTVQNRSLSSSFSPAENPSPGLAEGRQSCQEEEEEGALNPAAGGPRVPEQGEEAFEPGGEQARETASEKTSSYLSADRADVQESHRRGEGGGKEEEGEATARTTAEDDAVRASAMKVTHVGLLVGGALKLLVDLVTFFTSAIDDAVRDGSIVEEDVEGSKRVVEHWAAKIPPPTRDITAHVSSVFSAAASSSPSSILASTLNRQNDAEGGGGEDSLARRKMQMDRLRESFLACGVPGRVDFVESVETACYFLPLVWKTIDLLTPDSVCWDRSPPPPTPLIFSPLQSMA